MTTGPSRTQADPSGPGPAGTQADPVPPIGTGPRSGSGGGLPGNEPDRTRGAVRPLARGVA